MHSSEVMQPFKTKKAINPNIHGATPTDDKSSESYPLWRASLPRDDPSDKPPNGDASTHSPPRVSPSSPDSHNVRISTNRVLPPIRAETLSPASQYFPSEKHQFRVSETSMETEWYGVNRNGSWFIEFAEDGNLDTHGGFSYQRVNLTDVNFHPTAENAL
jgi:hypothetical protein